MKAVFVGICISFFPFVARTQPKDAVHPDWQQEVPQIIHSNKDLVHLYEMTWSIAADRVRKGPEGLPASPYLDENCYDDQIWIWDSCFMVMFSKYAPNTYPGKQTLYNLYLPIHEKIVSPLRVHIRDNPPMFAWIEYENYIFTGDREHVKYVLEEKQYLQRHFDYFNNVPKGDKAPAISPNPIFRDVLKDDKNSIVGFTWTGGASGMDNTVRGREAGGYRNILWIDAISQQALSALYISRLCDLYGLKSEKTKWNKRYQSLKQIVNERYWDECDGFYYDINKETGEPCRIKTPASFWAMLAEIPNEKQAERMVHFLKSTEFLGGKYPWNSLSRDDKDYNNETGDYWRGGIWLPLVYMGTKALEKYGYFELADELAENVIQQQLRTYKNISPHTIWECYNPSRDEPSTEHGRQARPDFCGWSALGPISLLIENVLGFRKVNALEKKIYWNLKEKNETHGIKSLKFGNIITDIVYDANNRNVNLKSNTDYILIINGKKYTVKAGDSIIKLKK